MSLAELARRVWFFLRRDRISADLAEEMRLHVELRARREREAGHDGSEAERSARRQFGNSAHLVEESRDQSGMRWADELMLDLRYGLRALRRSPLPSGIIVVTLAIGIGATLAMFTVMDAALFRPLPVREPEQLVAIPRLDADRNVGNLQALSEMRHIYDEVGVYAAGGLNLTGGAEPRRVQAGLVTPSVLALLGVRPVLGRFFTEDEGRPDGPYVVVLSHSLWRAQFGGDREVLGRRLSLNDRSYEIVGVMPPRFAFPDGSEVWIPLTVPLPMERAEVFRWLAITDGIARLAPGVTPEQANAEYVARRREAGIEFREDQPLPERHIPMRGHFAGDSGTRLWMVMGLAALLLVAACANICGLLLARWSARRREMAVRTAIGASRRRLLRQLVTESAVLAALGAGGGLLLASAGLGIFDSLMPPELAAITPPRIDERVLLLMLGLAVAATLCIGTLPALVASRGDLTRTIKAGGAASAPRSGARRLGGALVVLEVALAVVLLAGAGLLMKSLARLHAVETGIRPQGVATGRVALSRAKYPEPEDRRRFYVRLESELQREAGFVSAGLVSTLPLRGEWHPRVHFGLPDRDQPAQGLIAEMVYANDDYFDALGIRVLAGRSLIAADSVAAGGGAVISESAVREGFPASSPIGASIEVGSDRRVIVGVVNDVRGSSLDGAQNPQVYAPLDDPLQVTIVARGLLPAGEMLARVSDAVRRVDATQVVYDLKMMEQVAGDAVVEQRATSALATTFGAITLLLAALGLYGLLAFGVVQRTPELGIRFALGARRTHVVRAVVGSGLLLTSLGVAVGLGTAYGLERVVRSRLDDVMAIDTAVLLAVPAILLATALLAAAIPAVRAARVDPLTALKSE